jgi:hypothetical protein
MKLETYCIVALLCNVGLKYFMNKNKVEQASIVKYNPLINLVILLGSPLLIVLLPSWYLYIRYIISPKILEQWKRSNYSGDKIYYHMYFVIIVFNPETKTIDFI